MGLSQKAKKFKLLMLTTGGTIEKTYDEFDGSLENKESIIATEFVNKLRYPYLKIEIKKVLNKDSLYMNDTDRMLLQKSIEQYQNEFDGIVLLHGTDTMDQTAKYLQKNIQELKLPVVMTGAMRPLGFSDSDARQNLIESIALVQHLKEGIYISFHGKLFEPPNVRKNREKRTFESF